MTVFKQNPDLYFVRGRNFPGATFGGAPYKAFLVTAPVNLHRFVFRQLPWVPGGRLLDVERPRIEVPLEPYAYVSHVEPHRTSIR